MPCSHNCDRGQGRLLLWISTVQITCHRKFMVYFADKKSTTGFCFVSCYCIVVDDVNKQIGFHGNPPPLVNNAH